MLQVGIQNDGFTSFEVGRADTSYVSVMASQTLPWPGKLDLQSRQAELSVLEARQALARVRLATEAEVRRAHLDLVLVRRLLVVIQQLEATWQVASNVARVQYQSGTGAQADLLRAELSLQRLKQRRIALGAQEVSRVQALNRLRNHPLDEPIATAQALTALPSLEVPTVSFSAERALARSPELADARLGITRAARASAIAERSGYPDLTVGAGVMFRGALPPMWQVTLGAPVPLFSGTRRSHAAAESRALRAASTSQIAELEQLIRWKSKERETAFAALRDRVASYEQGLLPISKAAAENALIQYRAGKAGFTSVLEANADYLADEEGALMAIAAAHRLLIAEAEVDLGPTPVADGSAATPAAGPSGMGP
jgi:outer membrane protein TolC